MGNNAWGLVAAAASMGIKMDEILEQVVPATAKARQRKEQLRPNYRKSIAEHLREAKTQYELDGIMLSTVNFYVATKTAETWKKIYAEKTKEFDNGKDECKADNGSC
jgi:hypothetical protein